MYRLFIVEDDRGIAGAIREQAARWGFEVSCAENFRDVLGEVTAFSPHLVLMDISLPFYDGFYWCREIRASSNVPMIFISSASDNMNMIMAMSMGADDFIAKPFDMSVLMAKIQALLRRSYAFAPAAPELGCRGAVLDTGSQTLSFGGERVELSKNEYRILHVLLESAGRVVSRERLMQALWETDSFVDENTLTVNIGRLRKKLDAAGLSGFITTKFGVGYIVEDGK